MYLQKIYVEDKSQTRIESGFVTYFKCDKVANSGRQMRY